MAKLVENETIVVGYSYGGAVALKLALLFPEKVKALVLLAPAINPKTEKLKWWQSPAYLEAIRKLLPSDQRVSMEESIALVDQLKTLELETIHVPVVYVQGLNDNVVSLKTADYVRDRFTGTQVNIQMIENLDHHVPEKVPSLVAKIVEGLY
jgi:pimeloyl-ACP methyl ester carboxylesterase